jgi:hypothetical protein
VLRSACKSNALQAPDGNAADELDLNTPMGKVRRDCQDDVIVTGMVVVVLFLSNFDEGVSQSQPGGVVKTFMFLDSATGLRENCKLFGAQQMLFEGSYASITATSW